MHFVKNNNFRKLSVDINHKDCYSNTRTTKRVHLIL